MKTLNAILKVLTALATVAGAIYIAATYGEQIVAWAKKVWASLPKCPSCESCESCESAEPTVVAPAASAEEEEPAGEGEPAEEPAPEVVVAENEPVADETDFAE